MANELPESSEPVKATKIPLLKCPYCPQLYVLQKTMTKHINKNHPYSGHRTDVNNRKYKYNECNKTYSSFKYSKNHAHQTVKTISELLNSSAHDKAANIKSELLNSSAHDIATNIKSELPESNATDKSLNLGYSKQGYSYKQTVAKRIKKAYPIKLQQSEDREGHFKNIVCTKKFSSLKYLKYRKKEKGREVTQQVNTTSGLQKTSEFCKATNSFKCPYCAKPYTYKRAMTHHIEINHSENHLNFRKKDVSIEELKNEMCHKLSHLVSLASTRDECEIIEKLFEEANQAILDMRQRNASNSHEEDPNISTHSGALKSLDGDSEPKLKIEEAFSLVDS